MKMWYASGISERARLLAESTRGRCCVVVYGHFGVFLDDLRVTLEVKCTSGAASAGVSRIEMDDGCICDI